MTDIYKEELEYRKTQHKELIKILKQLKLTHNLIKKAEKIWVSPAYLTKLRNSKVLKLSTIEKYIILLK